nr:MAG TPA: hypothetical protein [Caudoviricetes sp.]
MPCRMCGNAYRQGPFLFCTDFLSYILLCAEF